jgi:hypothetical protein
MMEWRITLGGRAKLWFKSGLHGVEENNNIHMIEYLPKLANLSKIYKTFIKLSAILYA